MCDIHKPAYAVKVKVVSVAGRCKYHHKIGQEYNLTQLIPPGMCLDAFHVAYPYCLSLLYGAKFKWMDDKDSVIAQCPNPKGSVIMEIRRKIINHNKKKIFIKIIEIRGRCMKGLKRGQIFKMNLGDYPQICPAAFDELYPYISILRYGGSIPWSKEKDSCLVQCSDHLNIVTYELSRMPISNK